MLERLESADVSCVGYESLRYNMFKPSTILALVILEKRIVRSC